MVWIKAHDGKWVNLAMAEGLRVSGTSIEACMPSEIYTLHEGDEASCRAYRDALLKRLGAQAVEAPVEAGEQKADGVDWAAFPRPIIESGLFGHFSDRPVLGVRDGVITCGPAAAPARYRLADGVNIETPSCHIRHSDLARIHAAVGYKSEPALADDEVRIVWTEDGKEKTAVGRLTETSENQVDVDCPTLCDDGAFCYWLESGRSVAYSAHIHPDDLAKAQAWAAARGAEKARETFGGKFHDDEPGAGDVLERMKAVAVVTQYRDGEGYPAWETTAKTRRVVAYDPDAMMVDTNTGGRYSLLGGIGRSQYARLHPDSLKALRIIAGLDPAEQKGESPEPFALGDTVRLVNGDSGLLIGIDPSDVALQFIVIEPSGWQSLKSIHPDDRPRLAATLAAMRERMKAQEASK